MTTRLAFVLAAVVAVAASAQSAAPAGRGGADTSSDGLWIAIDPAERPLAPRAPTVAPAGRAFRLSRQALTAALDAAPMEAAAGASLTAASPVVITLPLPDGGYQRFRVEQSPIVDRPTGAVRTFRAQGLDDPTATARLDWGPDGFHGYILSAGETVYIDPWRRGDTDHYISLRKSQRPRDERDRCLVGATESAVATGPRGPLPVTVHNGGILRIYRFAVALTGEYTQAVRLAGDTDEQARQRAFDTMVTAANRIDAIFERELSIRLQVLNRLDIVYANPATDPYGTNLAVMLRENSENLGAVLGAPAFDLGHVLTSAADGGTSGSLAVVCSLVNLGPPLGDGPIKAHGATAMADPHSDASVVEVWAHEVGHQFGATHSFNTSCGGDSRTLSTAYEPGSGSTIMSFFGPCGDADLQVSSHDNFHVRAVEQILEHLDGAPPTVEVCGTATPTGNSVPDVNAGADVIIPRDTPFALTATASDPDGDTLTYSWEQYDLSAPSPPDSDADGYPRPIFRAYPPVASPTRTFPSLGYILTNANVPPTTYSCAPNKTCTTGEALPSISRVIQFQVTARDNRTGGGAIASSWRRVQVDAASGPFLVTSPNAAVSLAGGSLQTVAWSVANTANAPVSAAAVRISLSIDGGTTFPFVLAASTPNDGAAEVRLPNAASTAARVKVEAVGNVFFDISNADFTITAPGCVLTVAPWTHAAPASGGAGAITVAAPAGCTWAATSASAFITITGSPTGEGTGTAAFAVAANPTAAARTGTLVIAGHPVTVTQAAGNAAPTVIITTPGTEPATAASPFFTLSGTAVDESGVASVTWASNRGPAGTADGTNSWRAEVPVFAGENVFTVTATDTLGAARTTRRTVVVTTFDYYLAEGATGPFFDLDILIANPNASDARVAARFLREDGVVVNQSLTIAASARATIAVDSLPQLDAAAVSTVVTSLDGLPLLVERTMRWGGPGYGAHTEKAVAGASLTWFFAEGSQGFFDTYVLLANPQSSANPATIQFLTEAGGVVSRSYTLLPNARMTIATRDIPELAQRSFGITVTFTLPGVAERAMYFGSPLFNGGHESAGVTEPATRWYHAEGATGPYFDTFILISNPNAAAADVTLRFLPESGAAITRTRTLPGRSRLTVDVEAEDPALANTAVALEVIAAAPVISERTMFWPGGFQTWFESHNSFGVNATATKWGLAEGRVGNPPGTPPGQSPNFETYVLLANPGAGAVTVTIDYLRTSGAPVIKTYTVAAGSRLNVHVNGAVPELSNEDFAAVVRASGPIAVERALYATAAGVVWAAGTNATGIRLP